MGWQSAGCWPFAFLGQCLPFVYHGVNLKQIYRVFQVLLGQVGVAHGHFHIHIAQESL